MLDIKINTKIYFNTSSQEQPTQHISRCYFEVKIGALTPNTISIVRLIISFYLPAINITEIDNQRFLWLIISPKRRKDCRVIIPL